LCLLCDVVHESVARRGGSCETSAGGAARTGAVRAVDDRDKGGDVAERVGLTRDSRDRDGGKEESCGEHGERIRGELEREREERVVEFDCVLRRQRLASGETPWGLGGGSVQVLGPNFFVPLAFSGCRHGPPDAAVQINAESKLGDIHWQLQSFKQLSKKLVLVSPS
jgi:hypothetical protein